MIPVDFQPDRSSRHHSISGYDSKFFKLDLCFLVYSKDCLSYCLEICIRDTFSFISKFSHPNNDIIDLLFSCNKPQFFSCTHSCTSSRVFSKNDIALPAHKFRCYWFVRGSIGKKPMNMDACFMSECISTHY